MKKFVLQRKKKLAMLFTVAALYSGAVVANENSVHEQSEMSQEVHEVSLEEKDIAISREFVFEVITKLDRLSPSGGKKCLDVNVIRARIVKAIKDIESLIENFSPEGEIGQIILERIDEVWNAILDILPKLKKQRPSKIEKMLEPVFKDFAQKLENLIHELEVLEGTEEIVEILEKKLAEIEQELNVGVGKSAVAKWATYLKTKFNQAINNDEKLAFAKALRLGVL